MIAEYAAASKYCCTSWYATKSTCPGSSLASKDWKGYVVCGSPVEKLPGTTLKCGAEAGPICMGYNLKCFTATLENCKKTCARTTSCRIAEYKKATRSCCTSAVATKKGCKGSFVASKDWKGYVVCGAPMPKTTTKKKTTKAPTLPGTTLKCGKLAGPICMGYNMKCFKTSLSNCKATCKKTPGCKIAEYAAASKYCCTSRYATKSTCPGSFLASKDWKGYVVCGSPVEKLPGTTLKCGAEAGPICMGYNLKCFTATLENCKKTCARTTSCRIAEYKKATRSCCTSAVATKKECKGSFVASKDWKGYVVCGAPMPKTTTKKKTTKAPTLPGTTLKCGKLAGPIC